MFNIKRKVIVFVMILNMNTTARQKSRFNLYKQVKDELLKGLD